MSGLGRWAIGDVILSLDSLGLSRKGVPIGQFVCGKWIVGDLVGGQKNTTIHCQACEIPDFHRTNIPRLRI